MRLAGAFNDDGKGLRECGGGTGVERGIKSGKEEGELAPVLVLKEWGRELSDEDEGEEVEWTGGSDEDSRRVLPVVEGD